MRYKGFKPVHLNLILARSCLSHRDGYSRPARPASITSPSATNSNFRISSLISTGRPLKQGGCSLKRVESANYLDCSLRTVLNNNLRLSSTPSHPNNDQPLLNREGPRTADSSIAPRLPEVSFPCDIEVIVPNGRRTVLTIKAEDSIT
jgi:hypothetical protein